MKKYIALVVSAAMLILIIVGVGYTRADSADFVRGVRLTKKTAVERLDYSGVVEYADSTSAAANGSGVVQTLFVKNGDTVEAGDAVCAVCETYSDLPSGDLLSALGSSGAQPLISMLEDGAAVAVYRAESAGVVSGLELSSGSVFTKGQTLFRVSSQRSFRVRLNVSESDVGKVEKGQSVTIDCKALPELLHGTVSGVADCASQSGGVTSVRVTVAVENAPEALKTGYTAECSIITGTKPDVLLAPYSAVITSDGEAFVYAVRLGSVQKTAVATGGEYSNGIEIKSGLKSGDIVVKNAAAVKDSSRVVVNEVTVD